jgi:ADP-heptose:LPS heptosyltransferase
MNTNNQTKRSKAIFLNGGIGRILCAIPAIEKYQEESGDEDFIVVIEGKCNILDGHPTLDGKTYDIMHKNLFHTHVKNREIISPEPYRVWEYFNQKCNLSQAFDIILNDKGVRELPKPRIFLSKEEKISAEKVLQECKDKIKADKYIVFQPFGRAIQQIDQSFVDKSNRSIDFKNFKNIIRKLQKENYGVIVMSEFGIELKDENYEMEVAQPEKIDLRIWASIIQQVDHFLGCDSVGQHFAHTLDTPCTVITGATFPENTTYPNQKGVSVVDLGMNDRQYDPIRITFDERISRVNENVMLMTDEIENYVVDTIMGRQEDE